MERIRVPLESDEYNALVQLCEQELRSVPDQTRHIVREELKRCGLLLDRETEAARAAR
jgi:hypothetical protein